MVDRDARPRACAGPSAAAWRTRARRSSSATARSSDGSDVDDERANPIAGHDPRPHTRRLHRDDRGGPCDHGGGKGDPPPEGADGPPGGSIRARCRTRTGGGRLSWNGIEPGAWQRSWWSLAWAPDQLHDHNRSARHCRDANGPSLPLLLGAREEAKARWVINNRGVTRRPRRDRNVRWWTGQTLVPWGC